MTLEIMSRLSEWIVNIMSRLCEGSSLLIVGEQISAPLFRQKGPVLSRFVHSQDYFRPVSGSIQMTYSNSTQGTV
jgi:hypothetical protein